VTLSCYSIVTRDSELVDTGCNGGESAVKRCISSRIKKIEFGAVVDGQDKTNTQLGIPLTGVASLTIVFREPGMWRALQSGETHTVHSHRVRLCLLLAGLFLYNPFLVGAASSGGLNLRHPPSNRATIGSSELQQFKVTDGRSTLAIPEAASIEPYASLPDPSAAFPADPAEDIFSAQQFLCASLWFRPPPVS
jgi:hypothetical protein